MVSIIIHNLIIIFFFQMLVQSECFSRAFRYILSFVCVSHHIGCNGNSHVLEIKYKFVVPWQCMAFATPSL